MNQRGGKEWKMDFNLDTPFSHNNRAIVWVVDWIRGSKRCQIFLREGS